MPFSHFHGAFIRETEARQIGFAISDIAFQKGRRHQKKRAFFGENAAFSGIHHHINNLNSRLRLAK